MQQGIMTRPSGNSAKATKALSQYCVTAMSERLSASLGKHGSAPDRIDQAKAVLRHVHVRIS